MFAPTPDVSASRFTASPQQTKPAPFFQPKVTVNQPGDHYEQEADRVADQAMRMRETDAPVIQRTMFSPVSPVQRKCTECEQEEKEHVQRKEVGATGGQAAPSVVSDVLSSGGGQPLDGGTRQFMESRMGMDFSQVRVHTDNRAAESAQAIQARAYTSGRDVVFGAGEYQPLSDDGKRLLAHELVHTIQQDSGNNIQRTLANIRDRSNFKPYQHSQNSPPDIRRKEMGDMLMKAESNIVHRQSEEELIEEPPLTRADEVALSHSSPGEYTGEQQPLALSLHNFGIDMEQPKAEHQAVVAELALFLKATAAVPVIIRVIGFADSSGDAQYNLRLSRRRANAVKGFLQPAITQRISLSAYGETNPFSTNDTVAGRSRNRRVDIRFFIDRPPAPGLPPRPRPVPPGQGPLGPVPPPPSPPPPGPQPPVPPPSGNDDRDFCEEFPLLCGIGITPFFLPLLCAVAPEICAAAACLLNPLACHPPLPGPPEPPGPPDEPPRRDPDRGDQPTVRFTPAVRSANTPAGMQDRIGLLDPVLVTAVVVSPAPLTSPITINADTTPNAGEATVNGQPFIQITGTTLLEVLGTRMSAEGFVFNPYMQLAAWWGNDLVGESNRFAVSAIAENWSVELDGVEVTRFGYAFYTKMDWVSDSGAYRDLDACRYVELVAVIEQNGGMENMGTGEVNDPDIIETTDLHPTFDQHGTPHQYTTRRGYSRLKQIFRIRDMRSNSDWAPSTNSGFEIERTFERDPRNPRCWHLIVRKKGVPVDVNGMHSGGGAGDVSHEFRHIKCDPPPPPPPVHDDPPPPPPAHDDPLPFPPPGPLPCDIAERNRRINQCIAEAEAAAIDCTWGLVPLLGGWGGIGTGIEYMICLENMRRALLECDRRAKADTHCPDSSPPPPPQVDIA